jgi:hypothetical protein
MDTLKDIVSDIRIFLYGGMVTLPLTIAGTMLILGLFTANYAMLFFLLGFLIVAPLAATIIDLVIGSFFEGKSFNPFYVRTTDICRINVPYTTLKEPVGIADANVVSSNWVAMIAFFIGYIFTNGIELYNRESTETTIKVDTGSGSDLETKVAKRKTQAMIAIASIIIFALMALIYRFYTGCESATGMILSTIVFVYGGHAWYKLLAQVGEDRLSDLFGIANRLLSPTAIMNGPIACLPVKV